MKSKTKTGWVHRYPLLAGAAAAPLACNHFSQLWLACGACGQSVVWRVRQSNGENWRPTTTKSAFFGLLK
jgi:hypothetical protein